MIDPQPTTNVGTFPERLYWYDALVDEVTSIWGSHRRWKETCYIRKLCWYAALTTFLEGDEEDIRNRRRLLYYYLAGVFATESPDDPLVIHAHKLPVDTFLPKVTENRCIAYSEPVARTWTVGGKADEDLTATMHGIFEEAGMDGRLQVAEGYAYVCSGCVVRPYVDSMGMWRLSILSPDMFNYEADANGDILTMIVIPTRRFDDRGNPETVFEVWTSDLYYEEDYKGNRRPFADPHIADAVQMVTEIPNPYGRVPYEMLRLVEPNNNNAFSGGLFSVVEGNLACNMLRFAEDCSGVLESWGQWIAINLGFSKNKSARLGFGRMTAVDGVTSAGEGGDIPPSLDHVAAVGQHINIAQTRRSRAREQMRGQGIPDSIASDQGATPPSGLSRALERAELLEARRRHINLLRTFEKRLSRLTVTVYNVDGPGRMSAKALPTDAGMTIAYSRERIMEDSAKRLEENIKRLLAGAMAPSEFVKIEMSIDRAITDVEAITLILNNQSAIAPIRDLLAAALDPKAAAIAATEQTIPADQQPTQTA